MNTLNIWCAWASNDHLDELEEQGILTDERKQELDEKGCFRLPATGKWHEVSVAVDDEKAPESLNEVLENVDMEAAS